MRRGWFRCVDGIRTLFPRMLVRGEHETTHHTEVLSDEQGRAPTGLNPQQSYKRGGSSVPVSGRFSAVPVASSE